MLTQPPNQPPPPAHMTEDDGTAALPAAIAALRNDAGYAPRDQVLGLFRRHLARIQLQVREEFETYRMAGVEAAQRLTKLTDGVIRTLFAHAVGEIGGADGMPDQISIVATGGYGRMMLAPGLNVTVSRKLSPGRGPTGTSRQVLPFQSMLVAV